MAYKSPCPAGYACMSDRNPRQVHGRMHTREAIVCCKSANDKWCQKIQVEVAAERLSAWEHGVAEEARRKALEILDDTLNKPHLLMNPTEHIGDDQKKYWMKRYTVLTKDRVQNLRRVLQEAKFMKDNRDRFTNTFAYVYIYDKNKIIHLCPLFWEAPESLQKDSQPGTLIHEVSHFLGTTDIVYNEDTRRQEFCCEGRAMRRTRESVDGQKEDLKEIITNADNVEYEFEITLNHKGTYEWMKRGPLTYRAYTCCGERAENSVCIKSVDPRFITSFDASRGDSTEIKQDAAAMLDGVNHVKKPTPRFEADDDLLESFQGLVLGGPLQPRRAEEVQRRMYRQPERPRPNEGAATNPYKPNVVQHLLPRRPEDVPIRMGRQQENLRQSILLECGRARALSTASERSCWLAAWNATSSGKPDCPLNQQWLPKEH
ncbi:uncharacterized protein [Ambystoma mexicanum]|uniref:uncharacterized protein n=1 Tax=Ambystoma mexicanum TaxID=8296 RepID=UPI0037E8A96C